MKVGESGQQFRINYNYFPFAILIIILFLVQCGRVPPPKWPWWTNSDSTAVRQELEKWHTYLNPAPVWDDTILVNLLIGLNYSDSSSRTGDTIYKIAHLTRIWVNPGQSARNDTTLDIYQFGVTVDTLVMDDTFCQVIYRDSFSSARLYMEFDSLWVVGFQPDTIIDTTKSPPETTIVQRVNYTEKRGFPQQQQAFKEFSWSVNRWLFLHRDTMPDTCYYSLIKISGAYARIPNAEASPQISMVILSKPGRVDTIYFSPRIDGKGLTNLKPLDSIYTIRAGEDISILITTSTPSDTVADRNRFFVTVKGRTTDVTISARSGNGNIRFGNADTGYQHIYLKVLPNSNIFYPNSDFTGTVWAIPVRVIPE
jgi:hypothetical protein